MTYKHVDNLEVVKYSDSDFAGYSDTRKFTSRYVFLLVREVVSWRNVKQPIISLFTIEREFIG